MEVDYPQLVAALVQCDQHKACLVIAKINRLARSVAFVSGLMNSRVDFVVADMQPANRTMLHAVAAVAAHEREMISHRTNAALAAAKARAKCRRDLRPDTARARAAKTERVAAFRVAVRTQIQALQADGKSLRRIGAKLNTSGCKTLYAGTWRTPSARTLITRTFDHSAFLEGYCANATKHI